MEADNNLSPKHLAFCEAYLRLWNGTRAYMEVYPDSSYEAARSSATDLLAKPNIKAYIRSRTEGSLTAEETLSLLGQRARDGSNKGVQVRALGLALKVHGLLVDKSEMKVNGVVSWKEQIERSMGEDTGTPDVGIKNTPDAEGGLRGESPLARGERSEPQEPSSRRAAADRDNSDAPT